MDFGELFLHFLGDEFYSLLLPESLAQNMLMTVNALRLHRTEFKWGEGGGGRGEGERGGERGCSFSPCLHSLYWVNNRTVAQSEIWLVT